jgi:hypothetical protein
MERIDATRMPIILLVGSSRLARETGTSIVFAIGGGCPPILGSVRNCEALIQSGFHFAQLSPANTIVIAAQWFGYFDSAANDEERSRMYDSIRREIVDLRARGKKVFIILNIPIGIEFHPKARTTRHLFGVEFHDAAPVPESIEDQYKPVTDNLKRIASETGAEIIDPVERLCRNGFCLTSDELGRPAYKDGVHLRSKFVEEKATFIDRVFDQ